MDSASSSSSCYEEFLSDYKKPETRRLYEDLVKLTREKCEELLKDIKGKEIKGVVQGRVKKDASLEKKLKDLAQSPAFSTKKDIFEHPDMGDLAGVRIGLYFPNDIPKVVEEIQKRFDEIHRFGTVTDEDRSATQAKNRDINKHTDGRWFTTNADGTVDHWKHFGYESWQMVVKWKEPLPEGLNRVRVQMSDGPNSLKVELQVGTVVTQAWAEVQHNIIYKNPDDILATPSMKRMIDSINGLAITTDIMLNELEQSLEDAKTLVPKIHMERRLDHFNNELEKIKTQYMSELALDEYRESQNWVCSWHEADKLLNTLRQANHGLDTGVRYHEVEKLEGKVDKLKRGAWDLFNRRTTQLYEQAMKRLTESTQDCQQAT